MNRIVCTAYCVLILVGACKVTKPEDENGWYENFKHKCAWYNPYTSLEDCERDFLECYNKAKQSINTPFGSEIMLLSSRIDYITTRMSAKGYKLTPIIDLPVGIRQVQSPYDSWDIAGK